MPRHPNGLNKENPEIKPNLYGQLIFGNYIKAIQWGEK